MAVRYNSYLTAFPTTPGREATKLPTNDLLDLLEFGVLLKRQRAMHLHGFEPQEGKIKEFATFCEHLESWWLEDMESKPHTKNRLFWQRKTTSKIAATIVLTAKRNAVATTEKATKKTPHFAFYMGK